MKVKIFLSWSGSLSKKLAEAFSKWLPLVLNGTKSFYSADDITSGKRWSMVVANELEESKIGILFLTNENLQAPWLMFEAGALSKRIGDSKVCPILFGLKATDVTDPLAQFQLAEFEETQIKKVLKMINGELGEDALETENFNESFQMWWPKLKTGIDNIVSIKKDKEAIPIRSDTELLEEILRLSRASAAVILDPSKANGLEVAFRELSVPQQIYIFIDSIARRQIWTFYHPREGEKELGSALVQLLSGLIKSEKGELGKHVVEWLSSRNDNLIYFGSEVIGYFNTEFSELKDSLLALYKDLDKDKPWSPSQLNCLWAYCRLSDYSYLNNFLLDTGSEENQRWILVAYEQMVKAKEFDKRAEPTEFMPSLKKFIAESKTTDSVIQRAKKILEDFQSPLGVD